MTTSSIVKQTPDKRDLALLHAVIAYARANDWTHDSTKVSGLPLEHRWMRGDDQVSVWGARVDTTDQTLWPASVRQAVDLLVALGVLPAKFSSAYAAGQAEQPQQTTFAPRASIGCSDCGQIPCDCKWGGAYLYVCPKCGAQPQKWCIRQPGEDPLTAHDERTALFVTAEPATEEPTRTLTAVERDAEQYIAPVGAEEVPVDVEARIAQALDHIAAGRAVVWPAAGADDPNDEITGGAK